MYKIFTHKTLICLIVIWAIFSPNYINAVTIDDFIVPSDFKFTRNILSNTIVRPDVSYLQNILNMSTSTQVAVGTDAGSNNNLTNYFGNKTRDALARFQILFAKDIDYEYNLANSNKSNIAIFKTNSDFLDTYSINVLNKLILLYTAEKKNIDIAVENKVASTTTINTTTTNTTNNTPDIVRFDIEQEKARSTDISPTGIDKNIFEHTPEGQLTKLIGGYALVDQVYNYTPGGFLNNTISGISSGQGLGGGVSALSGLSSLGGGGNMSGGGYGTAIQAFGGKTTSMVTCTCSANLLLYVQDVRGTTLPLMYQPGVTKLYNMYRPTSGVNVLGKYVTGGQCLIYEGVECSSGGNPVGTMTQLGTSLSM